MDNLEKHLIAFLRYIEFEKGYSKNTLITYEQSLRKFIQFLEEEEIKHISIVNSYLFTFIKSLRETLGENSVKLIAESCKSFFKFLKLEDIIKENPASYFERTSIWKRIPEILQVEEVELIINSLSFATEKGSLYRSIIELLYGSGLRVSELCHLRASDFHDGTVRVICGKGGKDRIVPTSRSFQNALSEYWERYRTDPEKEDFSFVDVRTRLPLNRMQVCSKIKRIVKKCGITKNISPHSFRHTFATHLLKNGANIRIVQELLGHSSITSTDIYLHMNSDEINASFKKAHPRFEGKK